MSNQIIEVLHRVNPEDLPIHQRGQAFYRHAYRYNRMREFNLSDIWRENNVVDGTELPVTFASRSLMVGDVIRVTMEGATVDWVVEPVGWAGVDLRGARVLEPWQKIATHNTTVSMAWSFDHPGEFDPDDPDHLALAVKALDERVAELHKWLNEGVYVLMAEVLYEEVDTYELDKAKVVSIYG